MSNERIEAFKALEGKTIKHIDANSINVVHFYFTDGSSVSIDAEGEHYQIPVVGLSDTKTWFAE